VANKFDEFSKHLAKKQTRRGALKFLGAGLVSAFIATVFTSNKAADARGRERGDDGRKRFKFNQTMNETFPPLNESGSRRRRDNRGD
jgi:hypothetical protein